MSDTPNLLQESALKYAALGYAVFPVAPVQRDAGGVLVCACGKADCDSKGKHPLTFNGRNDASTNPAQIAEWWHKWPDANIGIATGKASGGLLVVDADPPHGAQSLRDAGIDLNTVETPTVTTGRDGTHWFFRMADGATFGNSASILPNVDVRGEGGYVIAAPSQHITGKRYTWKDGRGLDTVKLAPLPDALVSLLAARSNGGNGSRNGKAWTPFDLPNEVYQGEGRNNALHKFASSLRSKGLELEEIRAAVFEVNKTRCKPPLSEKELEKTVLKTVAKYPAGPSEEWRTPKQRAGSKKDVNTAALHDLLMQVKNANEPSAAAFEAERIERFAEIARETPALWASALPELKQLVGSNWRELERAVRATIKADKASTKKVEISELNDGTLTDLGNARRLVAEYGEDLRYVEQWKSWLAWDGRRWERSLGGQVQRCAKEVCDLLYDDAAEALQEHNADRAKRLILHAEKSAAAFRVRSMLELAASEKEVAARPEQFDTDPWLLNVENGILNLKTGELKPHDRNAHLTKLAPVAFDQAATAPRWALFLREIMDGNEEMITFLQRAVGSALTGDVSDQAIFFFHGEGNNGKTKFLEAIRALLGDYAQDANFSAFLDYTERGGAASPDIMKLRGARFVTAVEASKNRSWNTGLIKKASGGDPISGRHLYQEEFSFLPSFKLFFSANHRPKVNDNSAGFWRRMRLVPFNVIIPEAKRDPHILDKLKAELSGILNWALAGCLDWQQHGLGAPKEVTEATEAYQEENDPLSEFIDTKCELDGESFTPFSEAYDAYKHWLHENLGPEAKPLGSKTFTTTLCDRSGVKKEKRGDQRGFQGLKITPNGGPKTPETDPKTGVLDTSKCPAGHFEVKLPPTPKARA